MPAKGAKSLTRAENLLLTVLCKKFKFSAEKSDLAPLVSNGTKAKIPSEIKPPLTRNTMYTYLESRYLDEYANEVKLKYLPELVHLASWQSTVVAQYLASAKW